MTEKNEIEIDISLIIPVFNGAKWVEKCFTPILKQVSLFKTYKRPVILNSK